MSTSSSALTSNRIKDALRPIRRDDNIAIAAIIRSVLTEFGCTAPGFAIHDPEVDAIYEAYDRAGCKYFVVEHEGVVVGGCGIAPLKGGDPDVCELQKNYLLFAFRGHGYGSLLFRNCMKIAKELGYKRCYLETLDHMKVALAIYECDGFKPLKGPMGTTGHFACNRWYIKEL